MNDQRFELARTIQEDRIREAQRRRLIQEALAGCSKPSINQSQSFVRIAHSLTRLTRRMVPEPVG
jgi:hypothetical protein